MIDAVQYHDIIEENALGNGNIDYIKTSEIFAQAPMAFVVTKQNSGEDVKRIDDDHVYRKNSGDFTSMSYYLNHTKTLGANIHHPLIKELFYRIDYSKDDKTTLDFAYVMIEIVALCLSHVLENSTDFADRIESILRRAIKILLDEQVEVGSNDDKNVIDNHPRTPILNAENGALNDRKRLQNGAIRH